jgi:hypothetical protein
MVDQSVETKRKKVRRMGTTSQVVSPQLIIGVGLAVGFIISVPPMSSDARWFTASQSGDLVKFKQSLESSYLYPMNSPRLANAAIILQQSNLLDDLNPKASEPEKAMAMENMKRLDPKNPDILKYR